MNLPAFDTQFCLISEQAIPNLTPLLDERLRGQTRMAVLFVSNDKMRQRAEWLTPILRKYGVESSIVKFDERMEYPQLVELFASQLRRYSQAVLNATGGKKIMSLAAHSVFVRSGRPVFYVERDNSLHWLLEKNSLPPMPLQATLGLETLLNAYGYQVIERQSAIESRQRGFAAKLFAEPERYAVALTGLQFLGKDGPVKRISSKDGSTLTAEQLAILNLAQQHGMVKHQNNTWTCGKEEAKFISGEWLELHVQIVAQQLGVTDVCRGLKFCNLGDSSAGNLEEIIKNEIDVAFVRGNQLFLVECKALRPEGAGQKKKPITDFIYTLESIKKSGGLATKAALVIWGKEPGAADRRRAEKAGIRIFSGAILKNLAVALSSWISSQ